MIDATLKAYATRQLGCVALAAALAVGLVTVTSGSDARTASGRPVTPTSPADWPPPTGRPSIQGPARVIDGDTIVVDGIRIRLEGIDAPESSQTCLTRTGQTWPCGARASAVLARLVHDRNVVCTDRGLDRYQRTLATCWADNVEINAEMVRLGFAWAFVRYSTAYVGLEAAARIARAGIWDGEARPAWEYRADRWQVAEPAAPAGCAIKGNVTANGRIYHMPWSPWYDKVKMGGAAHGKRWFCTEAEAAAAGWRPAQSY